MYIPSINETNISNNSSGAVSPAPQLMVLRMHRIFVANPYEPLKVDEIKPLQPIVAEILAGLSYMNELSDLDYKLNVLRSIALPTTTAQAITPITTSASTPAELSAKIQDVVKELLKKRIYYLKKSDEEVEQMISNNPSFKDLLKPYPTSNITCVGWIEVPPKGNEPEKVMAPYFTAIAGGLHVMTFNIWKDSPFVQSTLKVAWGKIQCEIPFTTDFDPIPDNTNQNIFKKYTVAMLPLPNAAPINTTEAQSKEDTEQQRVDLKVVIFSSLPSEQEAKSMHTIRQLSTMELLKLIQEKQQ